TATAAALARTGHDHENSRADERDGNDRIEDGQRIGGRAAGPRSLTSLRVGRLDLGERGRPVNERVRAAGRGPEHRHLENDLEAVPAMGLAHHRRSPCPPHDPGNSMSSDRLAWRGEGPA